MLDCGYWGSAASGMFAGQLKAHRHATHTGTLCLEAVPIA